MLAFGENLRESVYAVTDKQCYVAGERLHVSVDVKCTLTGGEPFTPSPSKVAYVEISDVHQMHAQAMVALTDGVGWADIPLPLSMYSGYYQMTVYTRGMRNYDEADFFTTKVAVVNPRRISRRDNVEFMPLDSCTSIAQPVASYRAGENVTVSVPEAKDAFCTLSIHSADLLTDALPLQKPSPVTTSAASTKTFTYEMEGHILSASPKKKPDYPIETTRIVMIGMSSTVFDGQKQSDGSYLYYTSGMYGNLPTLVNGYDQADQAVPMQLASPYARVLPKYLPKLRVYCTEDAMKQRSAEAQRQNAVSEWLASDTLAHSVSFMNRAPMYFYDMDEYTQFNTVREVLVEFVRGVKRRKVNGAHMLFTLSPQLRAYSNWPALVLLDGMPVYDIDEILDYDSHLLKYVQVYTDKYTFGNSVCQGVISFITRKGRLVNYKLDAGSSLHTYSFPQDHPHYVNHTHTSCGTSYWNPRVEDAVSFVAPSSPGVYEMVIQGVGKDGKAFITTKIFEVK